MPGTLLVRQRRAASVVSLLLLTLGGGCASQLPAPLRQAPPGDPGLAAARNDPQAFRGERVRWGGQIVSVENATDSTDVQVVGRPLDSSGRPRYVDQTEGRFIARYQGFVDPAVYARERELTVVGTLDESREGLVGDFRYTFPVLQVEADHLWPKRERMEPYPYPYPPYYPYYPWRRPYYDPFYDPWWW